MVQINIKFFRRGKSKENIQGSEKAKSLSVSRGACLAVISWARSVTWVCPLWWSHSWELVGLGKVNLPPWICTVKELRGQLHQLLDRELDKGGGWLHKLLRVFVLLILNGHFVLRVKWQQASFATQDHHAGAVIFSGHWHPHLVGSPVHVEEQVVLVPGKF